MEHQLEQPTVQTLTQHTAEIHPQSPFTHIVFFPGNFGTAHATKKTEEALQDVVLGTNIPFSAPIKKDLFIGRMSTWVKQTPELDSHTLAIGYSTGATHVLKLAETSMFQGIILDGPYDTHKLGVAAPIEKMGGRFDTPFDWEKLCKNVQFIAIIAPKDDHIIPENSTRRIIAELKSHMPDWEQRLTIVRPEHRGHLPSDGLLSDAVDIADEWIHSRIS